MNGVSFQVHGKPVPGGTVRPVPIKVGGQVVRTQLAPGRNKEGQRQIESWKGQVSAAAAQAMGSNDPLTGPVAVRMYFTVPRRKGDFGSGRNADKLKPSAPSVPITRPDLDKFGRLVQDAMSGIVFVDDSQITDLFSTKRYGSPGVRVQVRKLEVASVGVEVAEAA